MAARRVVFNAGALMLARLIAAGVMIATIAVVAHRLSLDDFGRFGAVAAAGFVANLAVSFGTDTVVTRRIASGDAGGPDPISTTLKFQLGVAATFVVGAGIVVLTGGSMAWLVQALALLPMTAISVTGAALRGAEVMTPFPAIATVSALASLLATLVLTSLSTTVVAAVAGLAIGSIAGAAMSITALRRHIPGSFGPGESAASLSSLLREAAPFAAMVIATAATAQGSVVLVELLADEPTGGYAAGMRLVEAIRLVPAALVGALFPSLVSNRSDQRGADPLLFGWLLVASLALLVGAPWIDEWIFDSQPDGVAVLRVMALVAVLVGVRLRLSVGLMARSIDRPLMWSALAGLATFVVVGTTTTVRWGVVGASWAQVVALIVAIGVLGVATRRARLHAGTDGPVPKGPTVHTSATN